MAGDRPHIPGIQTASVIGTYLPRQCGIATFSKDLRDALARELGEREVTAIAMDDSLESYPYPSEVRFQIPAHRQAEYGTAADLLNINQIDVAIVQHEYGIYGGPDGAYVVDLMRRLRMPIVSTLHTVLREPSSGQRAVMRDLITLSDRLVVMSQNAFDILGEVYGAPEDKLAFIPHGIPDVPFVDSSFYKDQFGFDGRTVMLTFGLLGPGKGIEVVIKALPRIVKERPDVLYVILGATHPHVLKREGNAYRHSLERLAEKHGVLDHVVFYNRYVTIDELCRYIGAADLYVTPYPNLQQITSGTLAYSLGAGKAVVSTPYLYAQEMLAEGRGRLFNVGDSEGLAGEVLDLLGNEVERNHMRKRAYMHCRKMVWKEVARAYLQEAAAVLRQRRQKPRPVAQLGRDERKAKLSIPELSLTHLFRMTDDTGMIQHAIYSVPDRYHGYSTDDNARALVAALMAYGLQPDDSVLHLADIYMSFLHHAFNPGPRRFRNFMSYDRTWLEEFGSEDVHGRCLWALGMATALSPNHAILAYATRLFNAGLETAPTLGAPRSWAFALVGIHAYLQRFGGDTQARRVRTELAERLYGRFKQNATPQFPWFEDVVTYDNAKLPHALMLAGQWIPNHDMLQQGLTSLQWLIDQQFRDDGTISLIGNMGWLTRQGHRARFDQQPVEAMALVEACAEAYRYTQDKVWLGRARRCLEWFIGANDTRSVLYDYQTGGCRDGLHADGPNLNQGAESTLAWIISLMTVMELDRREALSELVKVSENDATPELVVAKPAAVTVP